MALLIGFMLVLNGATAYHCYSKGEQVCAAFAALVFILWADNARLLLQM